jgi:pyruvate,orthophosphate dikinase
MQDMEFTIERGKLYMLQTRNGKRTAQAALKIAVALVREGLCTREEALLKIEPKQLDAQLHPRFDEKALKAAVPVAAGLAASPGAACGGVYFTAEEAKMAAARGPVLLVRTETSPEDIEGMSVAQGILTARGGRTSHAAGVARGMGTCCVAGCGALHINEEEGYLEVAGQRVCRGEIMSIDGTTGNVYIGEIPRTEAEVAGEFATVMGWADEVRRLKIRANADTPADAAAAVKFARRGSGLPVTSICFCTRTHSGRARDDPLAHGGAAPPGAGKNPALPAGRFEGIIRAMLGRPVTIRLLDPRFMSFFPPRRTISAPLPRKWACPTPS